MWDFITSAYVSSMLISRGRKREEGEEGKGKVGGTGGRREKEQEEEAGGGGGRKSEEK